MNKNELKRLSKIELEHILIELNYKRGSHLRHFIDQYFCFKYGYVVENSGNPIWEKLVWKGVVSEEASKTNNRKHVVKDHIVPLSIIKKYLLQLKKPTTTSIEQLLNSVVKFGTIHVNENIKLDSMGLKSEMPNEFYDIDENLYGNIFARYIVAGIDFKEKDF